MMEATYHCTTDGSVSVEYYSAIRGDGLSFDFNDWVKGNVLMEGNLAVFELSGEDMLAAESYSEDIAVNTAHP